MMDIDFERRVTGVEQFFRKVNDTTTSPAEADDDGHVTVLCECALVDCTDPLRVPVDVYRDLHLQAAWFIVRPQHSMSSGSVVVDELDDYWIVQRPELPAPDQAPKCSRTTSVDQMLLDALTRAIAQREHDRGTEFAIDHEMAVLREQVEQSRIARRRYEFALDSYEQLMRHRIANPLAVICGVAQTLQDKLEIGEIEQAELLESLLEQANSLQSVVLAPRANSPTEFVLEPWPSADR